MCLGHMIDELDGIDPDAMSDGEVTELVQEVRRLQEHGEALALRAVGTFGARKLHAVDGARSAGAWLKAHTDLSGFEANSLDRDRDRAAPVDVRRQGHPSDP
jgi:hypothetical protein